MSPVWLPDNWDVAIEYLNISRLVIDFATSPVRTGNSFFDKTLSGSMNAQVS